MRTIAILGMTSLMVVSCKNDVPMPPSPVPSEVPTAVPAPSRENVPMPEVPASIEKEDKNSSIKKDTVVVSKK